MTVAKMSAKTVDILMGATDLETGTLAGLDRRTAKALDVDLTGVSTAELTAGVAWALNALNTYPTTPAMPDVKLTIPLPAWEEM